MNREKREFLLPHPRGENGGGGVARVAAGDPRLDMIEAGPLRGRRAVRRGLVRAIRKQLPRADPLGGLSFLEPRRGKPPVMPNARNPEFHN